MKKNILDPVIFNEISQRIENLRPESVRVWGTMNVDEMLCHCKMPLKNALRISDAKSEAGILKRFVFRYACVYLLRKFPHNAPTGKEYNIKKSKVEISNLENERVELLSLLWQFYNSSKTDRYGIHPLFGSMSNKEWGIITYMHLDHHLRQFGG